MVVFGSISLVALTIKPYMVRPEKSKIGGKRSYPPNTLKDAKITANPAVTRTHDW